MGKLEVVILAAGKGTRMRSSQPKVMHNLGGKPLLQHVLETAAQLDPLSVHLVVGHGANAVSEFCKPWTVNIVQQAQQLGTGHAVLQVLPDLSPGSVVLVLYGDVPLTAPSTLTALVNAVTDQSLALLTVELDKPSGYGRILRDEQDEVVAIVEEKDATPLQRQIREVNSGVMAIPVGILHDCLPHLNNQNAQGEYYLTDLIASARNAGYSVSTLACQNSYEVFGVNDRSQQAELERYYQKHQARQLMQAGVTLADPARFDCRGSLTAGADCFIDINCVFEGDVSLGSNVSIGPNCIVKNARIGDNVTIHANTLIEDSLVGADCVLGPYARLRPGSELARAVKIGNFVEIKKALIGEDSKVNHLSYVGDAEVGNHVNIGAGTITCNYDGVNKHKTLISDGVFVGSNTALVAPVIIASGTTIAAGSTVTQDSKPDQLVVARSRQRNIDGWKRPAKK